MAMVTKILRDGQKPTEEELYRAEAEWKEAMKYPITFDEDCPELTDEELLEFRRVSDTTPEERRHIAREGAERRRLRAVKQ
ncbi:hypothetical protein FACS1894164_11790 [Spirochaetia bacterium]|nr:hypothetical protein FACS1894164_11790 [Spirochaetia bacterium]